MSTRERADEARVIHEMESVVRCARQLGVRRTPEVSGKLCDEFFESRSLLVGYQVPKPVRRAG